MATNQNAPFIPRVVKWSSAELLKDVTPAQVTASTELRQKVHHDLWGDMCAEHDAENLWDHLQTGGRSFSMPFLASLAEWRSDERNHYIGLRQICSQLYDIEEREIDRRMALRAPDFRSIENFISDEFRTCVVLAYDELVSARGYKMFFNDFKAFGPSEFYLWVRWASRDEALHCQNFLSVIEIEHGSRIPEVPQVISEIKRYEGQPALEYRATFLLDHTEETFERTFLHECAADIAMHFEAKTAS